MDTEVTRSTRTREALHVRDPGFDISIPNKNIQLTLNIFLVTPGRVELPLQA